jgi:toxin-antitoxin system PIN domain toxin
MRLPDVNVLLYAFNRAADDHDRYRAWLDDALSGDEPVAVFDAVLAAVVRIATHPRLLDPPATLERAFAFTDAVRAAPASVPVFPGPRHWQIFERVAHDGAARGNLVSDAYLAALALESGSELVTTDRDFARFPGLRWRHPLT